MNPKPRHEDRLPEGERPHVVSRWEWVFAALGALLVVAVVGLLLDEALFMGHQPPGIALRVRAVTPVAQGYLVQFQAHNLGGQTLAGLQVKATLRRGDGSQEEREAQLDYVPPRSTREGGFFFESDPRQGQLTLAPGGFQVP